MSARKREGWVSRIEPLVKTRQMLQVEVVRFELARDWQEIDLEELLRKHMHGYDENNESENAVIETVRKHNWRVRVQEFADYITYRICKFLHSSQWKGLQVWR